jgi:hypothetical protein
MKKIEEENGDGIVESNLNSQPFSKYASEEDLVHADRDPELDMKEQELQHMYTCDHNFD